MGDTEFSFEMPGADPGEDATEALLAPRLNGRDVYLRPPMPADYEFIQRIEFGGGLANRWRFRGGTPDPQSWLRAFWQDVLVQYLIVSRRRDELIGLAFANRPNFQDGHVYIGALRFVEQATPLMLYGVNLFIDHVFTCWNFRKVYFETTEYNYPQFASGEGRLFEVEGRLRGHRFYGGRYWDELILATTRELWMEHGKPMADAQWEPEPRRIRVRLPPRS
jgi:RimJ/RimL family protein N-acetyltransferase